MSESTSTLETVLESLLRRIVRQEIQAAMVKPYQQARRRTREAIFDSQAGGGGVRRWRFDYSALYTQAATTGATGRPAGANQAE